MASLIITLALMLLLSIYFSRPVVEDVQHEVSNFANFVTSTTMRDIRDEYQAVYDVVDVEGRDLDLFVYQMAFKMAEENCSDAREFIGALSLFIVPPQINVEYSVGGCSHFQGHMQERGLARSVVNRNILTFYVNDSDLKMASTNITMWS